MSDIDWMGFLSKLFDRLSKDNEDIQKQLDKQTEAISALSSHVREGIQPQDIKDAINNHHDKSGEHLGNIDTCTETIDVKSDEILDKVDKLSNKVKTMIIVVCVAFGLLTMAYFVVRATVDTRIEEKSEDTEHSDLKEEIEEIKRLIENLDK